MSDQNTVEKDFLKKKHAMILQLVLKYKSVSLTTLANKTGVSRRTLEGYYAGARDIANAPAHIVLDIEHFLDIDGRILTESVPVEEFFASEEKKLIAKIRSQENSFGGLSSGYMGHTTLMGVPDSCESDLLVLRRLKKEYYEVFPED